MPDFDFFDLPDPTQRGFVIVADEKVLDCPLPNWTGDTPLLYSDIAASAAYKWIVHGCTVQTELQNYRLIHSAKAGKMQRSFYFAPTRTDEERETHFGKERWIKRMWSWPTVLLKLWFEKGLLPLTAVTADGDIATADRVHDRMKLRPGNQYPTWFRIRRFWSDEPFAKNEQQILPVTDSIAWSFDGSRGSLPEVLHSGCRFPSFQTSGEIIPGAGTINTDAVGELVAQEYPPTPMTDWEPYVLEDDRKEVIPGGLLEERILVEAFPPIDDREITA